MYLDGSPTLVSGDVLVAKLFKIQHRINNGKSAKTDLVFSFIHLIESCISQAPTKEQNSIARIIDQLFTSAVELDPSTYNFLNPCASTRRSSKILKKNSPKSIREDQAKTKRIPLAKEIMNLKKQRCVAQPSTSAAAEAIDTIGVGKTSSYSAKHSSFQLSTRRSQSESSAQLRQNSRRSFKHDDCVQSVLKAVELASDDLSSILLCKLLHGYIFYCKLMVSQKRLRQMVRLDAANYCLRAIRSQIAEPNPSPLKIVAIDSMANALMEMSVKDRKFSLKIRISGMLSILGNRLLEADRLFCTVTLLQLTSRSLRSPRNAQLVGRERQFAERLISILNALSAATMEDNIANEEENLLPMNDTSRGEFSNIPGCQSSQEDKDYVSTNSLKMAQLTEILFFVSKNKKNRTQLLDQEIIGVLKTILEHHFEHRQDNAIHLEIAIITLACIRQLSRTNIGKEQLMRLEVIDMCESYIAQLDEDKKKITNHSKILTPYVELQDSLCALCMRFLPQLPFPLPQDQLFPLQFIVPCTSEKSCDPVTEHPTSSARSSTSPQKKTPNSKLSREKWDASQLDDTHASSDDEDDDSFLYINNSDQMDDTDGHANFSDADLDDYSENLFLTSKCQSASKLDDLSSAFNVNNYSRQKLRELKSNYRHLFDEFEQGAVGIGNQSPKMRKSHASTSSSTTTYKEVLIKCANATASVGKFVKIAYPEMLEEVETASSAAQPFLQSTGSIRDMIAHKIPKSHLQPSFQPRVVFDLDRLIKAESSSNSTPLGNSDLERIGRLDSSINHLKFESRFESGNLRQVTQVSENHYELILSPDINQHTAHFQWFYFEVSNNRANVPYTFEVINCLKNTSMFSKGMQPVMFSVSEAQQGRAGWVRIGSSVCYYRNLYCNEEECAQVSDKKQTPTKNGGSPVKQLPNTLVCGGDNKNYFSARFTISFLHQADICYIAYHFPYTYSYLKASLEFFVRKCLSTTNNYVRSSRLTQTLGGNDVPLLTITAPGSVQEVCEREVVLLSARVHPGESNASWIMQGILQFLCSEIAEAKQAREAFIFKIIPMLNPDGVINGSHRCSLAGVDLNRMWGRPSPLLHPTTFNAKGLIQYMADVLDKPPWVFVDLHGHSRRPNIFMYGNNPEESWRTSDHYTEHNFNFLVLPHILEKIAGGFSLQDCRFSISKSKEFSARIAVWRQFGMERVYTMEATYSGFDLGPMAGKQIRIKDLKEIGVQLCQAILRLKNVPGGSELGRSLKPEKSPAAAKNKTPKKSVFEMMEFGQPLAGKRLMSKTRKSLSFCSKP